MQLKTQTRSCAASKIYSTLPETRDFNHSINSTTISEQTQRLDKKFYWLKREDTIKSRASPKKHFNQNHRPPKKRTGVDNNNANTDSQHETRNNRANSANSNHSKNSVAPVANSQNKNKRRSKLINENNRRYLKPDNNAVVNLVDTLIPPEVITLLSKRMGFVPTTKLDQLEIRNDCDRTMAKLAK